MSTELDNTVAAGIVLFNPDFVRLNKSIIKLAGQVDKIILFNNKADITKLKLDSNVRKKVEVIGDGANQGIAFALNELMQKAKKLGYKWVITLDQDSIVPENLFFEYSKYLSEKDIAIICPQVIDKRRKYEKVINNPKKEYVNLCITSGSCTNVSIWDKVGQFDTWLFIDLVDNDFCKRVILSGYKILKLNSVILDHEYGTIKKRSKLIEKTFLVLGEKLHNTNISKLSFKRIVNPMRMYYENRNTIYLNKKFKKYGGIGYENHHSRTYLGFFVTFSLYSLIVGKDKRAIYKAIINGIRDGRKKAVKEWKIVK